MLKICGKCFQTLAQKECKTERKEADAVSPSLWFFAWRQSGETKVAKICGTECQREWSYTKNSRNLDKEPLESLAK